MAMTGPASAVEQLDTVEVRSTVLHDVSGEQVKSADLAEALARQSPAISIVRRSGIANDIILRGQKKDNINVTIDNTKIYGACPNRMDPPISHVATHIIYSIEIIEGPYDVENFGTLSGIVKVRTKKPEEGFAGEISLNLGSFDYRGVAATVSGGSERVRFLLSVSNESSAQYEDGDGNTFAEQIEILNPTTNPMRDPRYKNEYKDIDAYEKSVALGKIYINFTENQEMRLSYTANRSDDILYPSSRMDALYEDSDIFNIEYSIKDWGSYSKLLDVQYYHSKVEHPMSTFYRVSSGPNSANEVIHRLTTDMQGLRIKNSFDLSSSLELTIGVDTSKRNWDGAFEAEGVRAGMSGRISIDDVDTENAAIFAEIEKKHSNIGIKAGLRFDDTRITPANNLNQPDNDYSTLSANIFMNLQADTNTRYFAGVGRASRVPDARELYFKNIREVEIGTPTLDETTNTAVDFGIEKTYDNFNIKTKLFYSWLSDFIYFNSDKTQNAFENIDATIYGFDVSGSYFMSETVYVDFGLAYQRGQKDKPLAGQSDTDLAEIPPMKLNVALNFDYSHRNTASIALLAVDDWDNFDSDNGEQAISGYGIINVKVRHAVTKQFELIAGINNIADKTYAASNTYKDLTLLADGAGAVMLMNEPGRFLYVRGTYRF